MHESFRFNDSFLQEYRKKIPPWGPLGYVTYLRTYARPIYEENRTEQWWETIKRVVEGTYTIQKDHCKRLRLPWNDNKAQKSAQEMYRLMFDMKFLPPGRGLWMMGTPYVESKGGAALNNPLGEDTKILTGEYGWVRIGEIEGQEVHVLSNTKLYGRDKTGTAANAKWVKASVSEAEEHPCADITYQDKFGAVTTVKASLNHRWFRRRMKTDWERVTTEELSIGDYLPITRPPKNYKLSLQGCQHGFFFGDGTRSNGELHQFDDSISVLKDLFTHVIDIDERHSVVRQCPLAWGQIPQGLYCNDQRYLYGFLAGYLAADGHVTPQGQVTISSARLDELTMVHQMFFELGIRATQPHIVATESNLVDDRNPLYGITINPIDLDEQFFLKPVHRERWLANLGKTKRDWLKITNIRKLEGTHRVLCATVPDYEQFVIEGFCLTSNCAFVSTKEINIDFAEPFTFLMDMSMLGVGVGGDTKGAGLVKIKEPRQGTEPFVVEDSREGWVELVRTLLNAYVGKATMPSVVDMGKIRAYGEPIKGFGGTSSGPGPLMDLVDNISEILNPLIGKEITSKAITDLFNAIGKCVVSGNVRRSAEIMFGSPDDLEFLDLKNPENPENKSKTFISKITGKEVKEEGKLFRWRWASNNSIFATVGMDYTEIAKRIAKNGEPGLCWLDTARAYGRLCDLPDNRDALAEGTNPCLPKWATIMTNHGAVPIEDLIGKQFTAMVNGKYYTSTPTGFWQTATKTKIYKYITKEGYRFESTANHRVEVITNNGTDWLEAEKLKSGDKIILHNHRGISWKGEGTFEEGWLLGSLKGDGHITNGTAKLQYWGTNKWFMLNQAHSFIQKSLKVRNDCGATEHGVEERDMVSLSSTGLLGLAQIYMVKTSTDLQMVVDQYTSSQFYAGFLSGWFDADGSVQGTQEKGCSVRLSSIDREDLYIAQQMLLRLGVTSTIYQRREPGYRKLPDGKGGEKEYYCQTSFELIVSNDSIAEFADRVNFIDPDKKAQLANILHGYRRKLNVSKFYATYESSQLEGEVDVYDCEINEVHKFDSGGISLHNCAEQTLESYELCCLVETFPARHETYEEYERTLKFAYLYAKTVTLLPTHNERTNAVLLRNRRIGTSQSGISQSISKHGLRKHFEFSDAGYRYLRSLDRIYSRWLCIPESIKITSVKPSGTVSLLPGATPGIHFPYAEYYWRTIRMDSGSQLAESLRRSGYRVIDLPNEGHNTCVVYFPVHEENFFKGRNDVTIWEQLELAAQMQYYWADNQVSVTVTFKPEEASQIKQALELYETRLKSISFLPLEDHGYEHAPYQPMTKEEYEKESKRLKTIRVKESIETQGFENKFCDAEGACQVPQK